MSWVKTLKNRFKNIRRIPRQIRTGLEFGLPTRKAEESLKASFHPIPQVSGKLLDDATYGRHSYIGGGTKKDYQKPKYYHIAHEGDLFKQAQVDHRR